ncbi:MAG TPA: hypothetical protein VIT92_08970 [Burkholderiaceae bacterium]
MTDQSNNPAARLTDVLSRVQRTLQHSRSCALNFVWVDKCTCSNGKLIEDVAALLASGALQADAGRERRRALQEIVELMRKNTPPDELANYCSKQMHAASQAAPIAGAGEVANRYEWLINKGRIQDVIELETGIECETVPDYEAAIDADIRRRPAPVEPTPQPAADTPARDRTRAKESPRGTESDLKRMLADLHREYQLRAEPIVRALAAWEAMKPPTAYVLHLADAAIPHSLHAVKPEYSAGAVGVEPLDTAQQTIPCCGDQDCNACDRIPYTASAQQEDGQ